MTQPERNNEVFQKIEELKRTRKAIILAHNYQPPEIQDIADFTGDSLELSRRAAETDASVIVFCGVAFMAETAAVLNPEKIVILPKPEAGCPMADMITPEDMERIATEYPGVPIVTYVNTTAAVKAKSTICCTSANAMKIVSSLDSERVYMAPDKNLALYTARYVNKEVLFWNGYCPIHHSLTAEDVLKAKSEHPKALFIAHPECNPEVLDMADGIFSTSGMLRFVSESPEEEFIIGTEVGILYPMKKMNPSKKFYSASPKKLFCPDMKKIALYDVIRALETLEPRTVVSEEIRVGALKAIKKMLAISDLP
ncbi:MAG: quinolinate synthase NadA [Syntrophobacterales bacterium]|nr:quinolinate synthase NadA [Syntrophobacterales bacterium]